MIVVATEDFEVYHGVVDELRDRDVRFTTISPGEGLPEDARVAIVGPDDERPAIETIRAEEHRGDGEAESQASESASRDDPAA